MWLALATSLIIQSPGDLVAAAAASPRPAVCGARQHDGSLWSQTQRPETRRFCVLLSRAYARLESDPSGARRAADAAAKIAPQHPAPKVVAAQLALRREEWQAALSLFEQARKADPRSLDGPIALLAYARTLRRNGSLARALEAYRTLVPRAALLPSRTRRAEALLEAAHVALTVGNRDDEALAYLREATRDDFHARRTDVAITLALALHRTGRVDQADAILAERRGLRAWAARSDLDYVVEEADRSVLGALALEGESPEAAKRLYEQYVASPGAFEEVARDRLARLSTRRRR